VSGLDCLASGAQSGPECLQLETKDWHRIGAKIARCLNLHAQRSGRHKAGRKFVLKSLVGDRLRDDKKQLQNRRQIRPKRTDWRTASSCGEMAPVFANFSRTVSLSVVSVVSVSLLTFTKVLAPTVDAPSRRESCGAVRRCSILIAEGCRGPESKKWPRHP